MGDRSVSNLAYYALGMTSDIAHKVFVSDRVFTIKQGAQRCYLSRCSLG